MTKRETSSAPVDEALDDSTEAESESARKTRVRRRLESSWRVLERSGRVAELAEEAPKQTDEADFYTPDLSSSGGDVVSKLRDTWARRKVERLRTKAVATINNDPESNNAGDESSKINTDPSLWYKEFPRQQFAFEWGDAVEAAFEARRDDGKKKSNSVSSPESSKHFSHKMRYFSMERHGDGRRLFVAASLRGFWNHYQKLPNEHRHHYELIKSDTPCHLYYDLEFSTFENSDVNGEAAVDAIVALTLERLASEFELGVAHDSAVPDSEAGSSRNTSGNNKLQIKPFAATDVVIELKSTGSEVTKFSRHLVFKLPNGTLWKSAAHVGEFVRRLHVDTAANRKTDARCDLVFVRKEEGTETEKEKSSDNEKRKAHRDTSFVDLGVYTRNRAFRLYLSSKNGKKHRLLPTRRFLVPGGKRNEIGDPLTLPDFETFVSCLVSDPEYVESENARHLIQYDGVGTEGPYGAGAVKGTAFTGYGVKQSKNNYPLGGASSNVDCPIPQTASFICRDFDSWSHVESFGASVRSWAAYPDSGTAQLHMQGNRFCENVNRSHKSNNVSFTVDFKEGAYFQKCHDPECKFWKGHLRPLPDELLPEAVKFNHLASLNHLDGHTERALNHSERPKDASLNTHTQHQKKSEWEPPRIASDDDDDFLADALAKAETTKYKAPRFEDDENEQLFWSEAAKVVE